MKTTCSLLLGLLSVFCFAGCSQSGASINTSEDGCSTFTVEKVEQDAEPYLLIASNDGATIPALPLSLLFRALGNEETLKTAQAMNVQVAPKPNFKLSSRFSDVGTHTVLQAPLSTKSLPSIIFDKLEQEDFITFAADGVPLKGRILVTSSPHFDRIAGSYSADSIIKSTSQILVAKPQTVVVSSDFEEEPATRCENL